MADRRPKTARSTGCVGPNAVLPRYLIALSLTGKSILDYGAGPKAIHTLAMRKAGLDVTAHELTANRNEVHDPDALKRRYDVVFASNVLNVQPSLLKLLATLRQLSTATKRDGVMYANLPGEPRYFIKKKNTLKNILGTVFNKVGIINFPPHSDNVIFECRQPSYPWKRDPYASNINPGVWRRGKDPARRRRASKGKVHTSSGGDWHGFLRKQLADIRGAEGSGAKSRRRQ